MLLFPTVFAVALQREEALVKVHVTQMYLQFVCFFKTPFLFPFAGSGSLGCFASVSTQINIGGLDVLDW